MKTNVIPWITVIAAVLTGSLTAADRDEVVLFNGKNFDGWTPVISRERFKPEDYWNVADGGILVCKGQGKPSGYLRSTRDAFHDYTLTLQWRFPAGTPGGNSGVLLHTTTPGPPRPTEKSKPLPPLFVAFWPKSFEAQLNYKNAGDVWVIGTTCEIENADKRVTGRRHFNLTDDSERPIDEWNDYKIVCEGDQITIWVNGDLVNRITKCSQSRGAICLQAEGADIEFRDIRVKPLRK